MMRDTSAFTSPQKTEFRDSMTGAQSEQTEEIISHERSLSRKKPSTSFFTLTVVGAYLFL